MTNSITVLICDDDPGHNELIRKNLISEETAFNLLQFFNGNKLIDFLLDEYCSGSMVNRRYVLLLDIKMPEISGIEVLRKIKSHEILRRMPVFIMTTSDDPREISACYDMGCSSYIRKPVDHQVFRQRFHDLGIFIKSIEVPVI